MQLLQRTLLLLTLLLPSYAVAKEFDSGQLQQALASRLPEFAAQALEKIPEPGRKLLAARSYFRSHNGLHERWSWDQDRISAYDGSEEQRVLFADIESVNSHFSAAFPGHRLFINTQVRSLDKQLTSWNQNESVSVASAQLLQALYQDAHFNIEASSPDFPERLQTWLVAHSPASRSALAAPGLSAHGQMRAIDFQIMHNGKLVAQADTRHVDTVWREQGWEAALKASIAAAGPRFKGPLQSPDEPWHYSYNPPKEVSDHAEISP